MDSLLAKRDKAIIWHPFTQEKTAKEIIAIKKGKGSYVFDEQGNPYLDLISSWWVTIHGHAHSALAKALYDQAQTLEHVIFAGFTHEPAVSLCEGLQELLPSSLSKFFFSDNGSTAVEVALKMAYQYWKNLGETEKKIFISFEGGYHGDTIGAMSVGAKSGFHDAFKDLFFKVETISYPHTWEGDLSVEEKEEHTLQELALLIKKYSNQLAAFVLEPLVQGASGMRFVRPVFLNRMITLLKKNNILVIFDEVMTGFGRTGTLFALEQLEHTPDFLCVSKGITGGFLPLSLTITTPTIYEAFLHESWSYAFAHGHSYTANPLACAVAVASLNLLKTQDSFTARQNINTNHKRGLEHLKSLSLPLKHFRLKGTIAAFDVEENSYSLTDLKEVFMKNGLLLRPLGRTIYLLPPYCVSHEELLNAYDKVGTILKQMILK